MKRLLQLQILLTVLATVLVIGGTLWGYHRGLFQSVDNFLYDLNYKWRDTRPPSGKITLVLMDQQSSIQLKRRQGRWSRRHLAKAIHNLSASGAAVIGVDLIFSAPSSDPEEDRLLAAAMHSSGNVVLARISSSHGREITALDQFQAAMVGDGFIDVPLDEDNILRKIRFFHARPLPDGQLELIPAFALELARVFYNLDFIPDFSGKHTFRLGAASEKALTLPYPELLINFGGNYKSFPRISFSDAVHNRFKPDTVRGKLVLIGSSLVFEKDFFSTPYSRFFQLPDEISEKFDSVDENILGDKDLGIACHAWAAETILSRAYIHKSPRSRILLWTLLAGIIGVVFFLPGFGLLGSSALLMVGLAMITAGGHYLFISRLVWMEIAPLMAVWALQFVMGAAFQKSVQRQKSILITDLFGKYLAPEVIQTLLKSDLSNRLQGEHRNVTILFSDLREFTSLSENLGPAATGRLLNAYFDAMIPLVFRQKGTLDKLIGDAIMAFFGAPVEIKDHPGEAVDCALLMLTALDDLRKKEIPGASRLDLGIGINSGQVIVGNLGAQEFMDYTVIGDAVNLASRLESLNKVYGTRIIVGENTAGHIADRFMLRKLDCVKVIGKAAPVEIFELIGSKDTCEPASTDLVAHFETGINHYRQMSLAAAQDEFEKVLALHPDDQPAQLYMERIKVFSQSPPPEDWDGVTVYDYK